MDPDAVWKELVKALRTLKEHPDNFELREEVLSCLTALSIWIHQGGFPPNVEDA